MIETDSIARISEIKDYFKKHFNKEITYSEISKLSRNIFNRLITAESNDKNKSILTEIINDENKLYEFIFSELAEINAYWKTKRMILEENIHCDDNLRCLSNKECYTIEYCDKNKFFEEYKENAKSDYLKEYGLLGDE